MLVAREITRYLAEEEEADMSTWVIRNKQIWYVGYACHDYGGDCGNLEATIYAEKVETINMKFIFPSLVPILT